MGVSPISQIVRQSINRDIYNILCLDTHERIQSIIAKTNHQFYSIQFSQLKKWVEEYAPIPDNYTILNENLGNDQIPNYIDFDIALSQSKFGQFQILRNVCNQLHIPLISMEHTLPVPYWTQDKWEECRNMRGHINIFISAFSVAEWGFSLDDPSVRVIEHAIEHNKFKPNGKHRENRILSVVNSWAQRDIFCGYKIWERTIQGLPYMVVGDNPGLSERAKNVDDLIEKYNQNTIFYNTSTISPIPTSLLEAMSCGLCPVTTATCMIPDIIENGVNGFISNDEKELRDYLEYCLTHPEKAAEIGSRARQTILDRFSPDRYIQQWCEVFDEAANIPFLGI